MSFMLKKKRYKFEVDLCLVELSEVSHSKGTFFAKIRQMDGGSFTDFSRRMEVTRHSVQFSARFHFPCKMNANATSGVLETCKCRISVRLEEKGGKHFRKLGFVDMNLAEYAGAGPCTQRYILQPYDQSHRLDNSIVKVTVNITLKEGDTIFQRPLTRQHRIDLPMEDPLQHLPTPSSSESSLPLPAQNRGNLTVPSSSLGHHNGGQSALRVDAEKVINELMEGVDLHKVAVDEAEVSGLQLYVSKDGSVTFDKRNSSKLDLQPVVVRGPE